MNRRGNEGGWNGRGRPWRGGRGNFGRGRYFRKGFGSRRGNNNNNYSVGGSSGSSSLPQTLHQSSQQRIRHRFPEIPTPYVGWRLYFPDTPYHEHSATVEKVQTFEKYFVSWRHLYKRTDVESLGMFVVDFKELCVDEGIQNSWPTFPSDLIDSPEETIACVGLAFHQVISFDPGEQNRVQENVHPEDVLPFINPRIVNFDPLLPMRNLKSSYYGKFVALRGTVVRVGNCKPLCIKMAFTCSSCGQIQCVLQPDGKYCIPTKCTDRECRSQTFIPERSSPLTVMVDWQSIRLQEVSSDDVLDTGRVPRSVECELTNDLVDNCVPGDVVTVTGTVKVTSCDEGNPRQQREKCMYLLYVHANSVCNLKGRTFGSKDDVGKSRRSHEPTVEFSIQELRAIQEIQDKKDLLRLLVQSLCPAIYGHELVKAGLLLGLFGGTQKFAKDRNCVPIRGDPHVLIVGDPGLGKSQMLQTCAFIAPRGIYVCGNTSTVAGLTVTVTKEGAGGDVALEAGALVLADQGCCCIDEFDKMGVQHQALLEAMEQQSISIAKAGVVCSLQTRASILAAANPLGGHYNKAKTVSENLRLGSALLSRFDLVFILVDRPDEELDSMLSKHIMAIHSGHGALGNSLVQASQIATLTPQNAELADLQQSRPLVEKLRLHKGEAVDAVPHQLLRKYIAYARQYVHPRISQDAAKVLQEFYVELRRKHHTLDSTPITTRQLESLIRLTEARTRLELRETCTRQDAMEVVEIMKHSMVDTYSDGMGHLDFRRSQHGSGVSSRGQAKKFITLLTSVAERTYNSLFTLEQMKQMAKDARLQVVDFEGFIESLNQQNFFLKKGPRVYQLLTTGY